MRGKRSASRLILHTRPLPKMHCANYTKDILFLFVTTIVEGVKRVFLFSLLMAVMLPFLSSPSEIAFAQQNPPGGGLQVSPVIFDYDLTAGTQKVDEVSIINNESERVEMTTEVADFEYDEKGEMRYIEENQENPSVSSLKKWLHYDTKEFSLEPGGEQRIRFTVDVPANAEPGGHYGVIFFRTKPKGSGNIGVSARIGSLILVTIPGNVKKTGEVVDFKIGKLNDKNEVVSRDFFERGPLDVFYRVKNTGNVHFKPTGRLLIKDGNGKILQEIPPADLRVFPGLGRDYNQQVNLDPWGFYEAVLELNDGDGTSLGTRTIKFWGFNYPLVLFWAAIAIAVLLIGFFGIRQYNRWIVKKATTGK